MKRVLGPFFLLAILVNNFISVSLVKVAELTAECRIATLPPYKFLYLWTLADCPFIGMCVRKANN